MNRYDYSSTEGLYQTTKAAMEAELEAQAWYYTSLIVSLIRQALWVKDQNL